MKRVFDITSAQSWLQTIISLAIGSSFTFYMADRQSHLDYLRTKASLRAEILHNINNSALVTKIIQRDIEASLNGMDWIEELPAFQTTAMDAAFLRGSLDYASPSLTLYVGSIASDIKTINTSMQNLTSYKMSNGSMSNYQTRKDKIEVLISMMIQERTNSWLEALKMLDKEP